MKPLLFGIGAGIGACLAFVVWFDRAFKVPDLTLDEEIEADGFITVHGLK